MSLPGYSAGRHYSQAGGGSNYLCLPEEPRWKGHLNSSGGAVGWLFGAEYRMYNFQEVLLSGSNNGGSQKFHGRPAPCAVCYVPHRSAHLMIPASDTCPDGWTQEYDGYLMAEKDASDNHSRNYVCVDGAPEVAVGPIEQTQALLYFVKVGCGTLPCSKYHNSWELSCVVCTK